MPSRKNTGVSLQDWKRVTKESRELRRFHEYISNEQELLAERVRMQLTNETGRRWPAPFSRWTWESAAKPGHLQTGIKWMWMRCKLRLYLKSGGILILVGGARSGKTLLMERVTPNCVIENVKPDLQPDARIPIDTLPSKPFTIDETPMHSRVDVLRALDKARTERQGVALIFQSAESFKQYDIAQYMADIKVHVLELKRDFVK